MAQQDFTGGDGGAVFTLGLKVDPGSSTADAQKAGQTLAQAITKGFGALDLSKAVGGENLEAKFAEHGEAAAEGFAKGFRGKGEEAGKFSEGLTKGLETAKGAAGSLNTALEGVSRTLSSGSMTQGVRAFGELTVSISSVAEGLGGAAAKFGVVGIAVGELIKVFGEAAQAALEFAPNAAEATLSINGMAKAAGVSLEDMNRFRESMTEAGINADEMGRAFLRLQLRTQAAGGEIARSIRDAAIETADAQQRITDASRGIEAAQDGAAESAEKAGQAEARAAVTAATAYQEAAERRRELNLSVEGAGLGVAGAGLSLERAQIALRQFHGERISSQEMRNVRERELQLQVSQAGLGVEQAENREREARTRRTQAQMYGAMGYGPGGELGPGAQTEQAFRAANAARREEAEALDKVTTASREYQKAINAEADLKYKQVPEIMKTLETGRGLDLRQVEPGALQMALIARGQQRYPDQGAFGVFAALRDLQQVAGPQQARAGLAALTSPGFAISPTGGEFLGKLAREGPGVAGLLATTRPVSGPTEAEVAEAERVRKAEVQAIVEASEVMRQKGLQAGEIYITVANSFRDKVGPAADAIEKTLKGVADALSGKVSAELAAKEIQTAHMSVTAASVVIQAHGGTERPEVQGAPQPTGPRAPRMQAQQTGGLIFGSGGPTADDVPIMASAGEYVISAKAVSQLGVPFLDRINRGRGFQGGGVVNLGSLDTDQPLFGPGRGGSRLPTVEYDIPLMEPWQHALFTWGYGVPPNQNAPPEVVRMAKGESDGGASVVGGAAAGLPREGASRFRPKDIAVAGWPKGWVPQTNTSDWRPNTGFALGGLVGGGPAPLGENPFLGMANGGMIQRLPGGDGTSAGQHSLNLVTAGGEFGVNASEGTIEAIRSSSIGAKLTSTGTRPSWYS